MMPKSGRKNGNGGCKPPKTDGGLAEKVRSRLEAAEERKRIRRRKVGR